jgi:hypothetical protein
MRYSGQTAIAVADEDTTVPFHGPYVLALAYAGDRGPLTVTDRFGVNHVNAYKYYILGYYIDELKIVREGVTFNAEAIRTLVTAMDALMRFRGDEDPVRLRSSLEAADSLITELRNLIESFVPRPDVMPRMPIFSTAEQLAIVRAVAHLQSMLEKELGDMSTFSVEEKEI